MAWARWCRAEEAETTEEPDAEERRRCRHLKQCLGIDVSVTVEQARACAVGEAHAHVGVAMVVAVGLFGCDEA